MLDIAGERRQQPVGIAARRFDFNNVGAQVRQLPGRVGCWYIAELDHPKMTERGFAAGIVCFCQGSTFIGEKVKTGITTKDTKITKSGTLLARNLRVLRALRGAQPFLDTATRRVLV
jgi:hypothetical protein